MAVEERKQHKVGAVVTLATAALMMLLPAVASGWARAGTAPVNPVVQPELERTG